jgi:hypothetical protein
MTKYNDVDDILLDNQRMVIRVMGVKLGTASGWDQVTDWGVNFYDAEFNEFGKSIFEVDATSGVYIDFDTGEWQVNDDIGNPVSQGEDFAKRFTKAFNGG